MVTDAEMFEAIITNDCPANTFDGYDIHVINLHCTNAVVVRKNGQTVYFKIVEIYTDTVRELLEKIKKSVENGGEI